MLKKEITYKNLFTGEEETDTFYFNLTVAEVMELQLTEVVRKMMESTGSERTLESFKKVVRAAVLERQGNRPVKSAEYSNWFMGSDAYSSLFMEIFTSPEADQVMTKFIQAIIPPQSELEELAKKTELANQDALLAFDS